MHKATLIFSLLLLFSGCRVLGPDDPRLNEGEDHRETWNAFQDGTYHFLMNRSCFCVISGEHFVQVIDREISVAVNTWSNEEVEGEHLQYVETIDDLFNMIERAEKDADEFLVEYAKEGYPTLISIDWIKEAVDDEMYFQISAVQPGIQ